MKAGGQDIREQREIPDLRHRLILVRELQEVPVGVGDHEVLSLPALPATKVEAVCPAINLRIDVHADVGVPLLAVAAAPAGDVERD